MKQNNKEIEELINRTLDAIQAKWDKISEEEAEEEGGEGTVDFDILLDEVKEALIFVFEKGSQSKEKEMLDKFEKMINCREFNEEVTEIMNRNGFVTDDNECIWVTCNIVKDVVKERLQKLKGE